MNIRCQTCDATWDWDVILEDVPEGEEIFAHEYTDPVKPGVFTSYYCSPECLVKGVSG